MAPYLVERLGKHDRTQFDCGVPALNRYLQKQAGQEERRRITACYLLLEQATRELAGYYTLSASSVLLANLPKELANSLPRYPSIPIARIGRLAIDLHFQGRKLGSVLLFDALKRASVSGLGVYAIAVDAKDDKAQRFYEHHGFVNLASSQRTLFLPISEGLRRLIDD